MDQMDMTSKNRAFDAEDRKVYGAWLQGTLVAYGVVVFCGIAAVAVQAMTNTTAEFMTTAIALASP
jgi:hypothetical protein